MDYFGKTRTQINGPAELVRRRENAKKIFCKNNGRKYLTPEQRATAS